MSLPAHDERALAWQLRGAWARRREVRLTLTDRCMIGTVVGYVSHVAVTGAFLTVDGWHVPISEVLGVARPTVADRDHYIAEMRQLRTLGDIEEAA